MPQDLKQVFDRIAPSWYNYRHHTIFRQELEELAKRWQGGRLLNIGCGHGADFLPFKTGYELHGIDFSAGMLHQAQRYAAKFSLQVNLVTADIRNLPYENNTFDNVIAIATYHHLETKDRFPALQELKRVLKPGGEAYITVWNRYLPRFWFKRQQLLIPWKMKDQTLYRYYNLFTRGQLVSVARKADFEILHIGTEANYNHTLSLFSKNVCIVVKKRAQLTIN
jgi:tRNA (uracil-5-)-methyltransferase TRM9